MEMDRKDSAQKVDPGEFNSPAAALAAEPRTRDLSPGVTSPALYPQKLFRPLPTETAHTRVRRYYVTVLIKPVI